MSPLLLYIAQGLPYGACLGVSCPFVHGGFMWIANGNLKLFLMLCFVIYANLHVGGLLVALYELHRIETAIYLYPCIVENTKFSG